MRAAFEYGANCAIPSFTLYTLLPPGLVSELKDVALKYTKVPQSLKMGSAFYYIVFKADKSSDCLSLRSLSGVEGFLKAGLVAAWKEGTKRTFLKAWFGPCGMSVVLPSNCSLFCVKSSGHPHQVSQVSLAPCVCLLRHPHPNPR